jgi:hypothetical protein
MLSISEVRSDQPGHRWDGCGCDELEDARQADLLGRYWDARMTGELVVSNRLEPALAATVDRVEAIGAPLMPGSDLAARLWGTLERRGFVATPYPSREGRAP